MKKSNLTLSQACEGLIRYKVATGLSPHTVRNYRTSFAKLQTYFAKDPPFGSITRDQLLDFFTWLQEEYTSQPDGAAPRGRIKLGPKTILNIHTELSGLWTWAVDEGFVAKNLVRTIELPNPKAPVIDTFTKEDIEALIGACEKAKTWKTREQTASLRFTGDRDKAIILVLFDTGVRASELCDMKISDVNLTANNIKVLGKGQKERLVYFGKRTAKALWKYLTPRMKDANDDDRVFVVGPDDDPRPMTRDVLRKLVMRIGERAGVANVYPHRFRHSFAITYLRNGGDLFTLQDLLGHSDMAMVKRYAHVAQADCARAHQKASPVDNWKL
jgi:integrase/recombinase XerD